MAEEITGSIRERWLDLAELIARQFARGVSREGIAASYCVPIDVVDAAIREHLRFDGE